MRVAALTAAKVGEEPAESEVLGGWSRGNSRASSGISYRTSRSLSARDWFQRAFFAAGRGEGRGAAVALLGRASNATSSQASVASVEIGAHEAACRGFTERSLDTLRVERAFGRPPLPHRAIVDRERLIGRCAT